MAFTPSNQLSSDPFVNLRDQQHAARLFSDDQFRLAPKSKFAFHVAFNINPGALRTIDLVQKYGQEINMLVKSIDLPSFTVSTEMLNQYNRKKVVQYQHKPGDISIKFHDDNMGLINALWQNYYSYYYADPSAAGVSNAYNRNAMRSSDFIISPYGFDNGSTTPFFNYITIYQMARHEYVSYKLKNPIITMFNHNKVEYSGQGMHDMDMKIAYEAVAYDTGAVSPSTVEGFGQSHYDQTPSPLQNGFGGNLNSVLSLASMTTASPNAANGINSLNTVINQINNFTNTAPGIIAGVSNLAGSAASVAQNNPLGNVQFAQSTAAATTLATPINIGP
jgi:hypothetical protein